MPNVQQSRLLLRLRSGASLDADAATLIAAMTSAPSAARQTLISDTIIALKAAGIWAKLDELWFFAAHDSQAALLGWKRYKDCLAVNAPTFTADQGFAGNGATSYLNTQLVPSTHGVQYTLNDASLGVYNRTDTTGNGDMGVLETYQARIAARSGGGNVVVEINQGSSTGRVNTAIASPLGLTVARRTASNAIQAYRNGASVGTGTSTSTALSARAFYISATNGDSAAGQFTAHQYAYARVGASLSTQQLSDEATIIEAYMDAIGAG